MAYYYPTLSTLRQQALSQITAANLPGIISVLPTSILGTLAYAIAEMTFANFGYLDWISQQCTPFSCTGEFIDSWANLRGIYRNAPTVATGSVTFTGITGTTVPNGAYMALANGAQYQTTELVVLSGSSATVSVEAVVAGSAGNAPSGTLFTLNAPIAGLNSTVTASTDITGGTDLETDDSLRTRMLQAYQNPPQGGALSDYTTWGLGVPGVTRAWASAGGAGAGSVTVYTMFDVTEAAYSGFPQGTAGGATLETRITPATEDLLTVANYIYPLRPATALVYSVAPIAQPINVTFASLSPNTTAVQDAIASALSDLFVRIGSPLGSTVYLSDLYTAIESATGVLEFSLSVPSSQVSIAVGSLPTVGTLTF